MTVRGLHRLGHGSSTVDEAVVFGMFPLLSEELPPRMPEEAPGVSALSLRIRALYK